MSVRVANNIVTFCPDDDAAVSVALVTEGEIAWVPGIKPNVWSFRCSYREVDKLKGNVARTGKLCLYDQNTPAAGDPDVTFQKVRIVDCQPLDLGDVVEGDGLVTKFVEYRLTLADFRHRFVSPYGGRVSVGLVNPKEGEAVQIGSDEATASDGDDRVRMTFPDMVDACLKAMGLPRATLPPGVEDVEAPQEVKWFGNHAPSELEKLLKQAKYVFVPHLDGSVTVEAIGSGAVPTFPAADALPELRCPAVDRRGKTVVVTSYPTQAVETWDRLGPFGSWEFAVECSDGQWRDYSQLWLTKEGLLVGASDKAAARAVIMEQLVRSNLAEVAPAAREKLLRQLYRWVRVDTGGAPISMCPALSVAFDKEGKAAKPAFKGRIAVRDPDVGTWFNRDGVAAEVIHLRGGNLMELNQFLGTVQTEGSFNYFPTGFREMAPQTGTITYSFPSTKADTHSGKDVKFRPVYFEQGYTKEAGNIVELSAADTQNALNGGDDVVVVTDPTLQLRSFNGQETNRALLLGKAKSLVQDVLAESGVEIRHLMARGYQKVELSGVVSKVTYDPSKFLTHAEIANWRAPGASLDPARYREKVEEAYPNQADTQAVRAATSESGDRPLVIPVGNSPALPDVPPPNPFHVPRVRRRRRRRRREHHLYVYLQAVRADDRRRATAKGRRSDEGHR